jgi:beta-phosphoglucomutase
MRSAFLDGLGVHAVIFDVDGVLLETMSLHYQSYRRILEPEGLSVEPIELNLREGLGTPAVLASLCEEKGWGLSPERIEQMVVRRRNLFLETYEHRVYPHVPELLAWLEQAGYRLGVVSGATERSLDVCLREHPAAPDGRCLADWFPIIISGSAVARGKPHPDPYLAALTKLSLEGRQALVVENAPLGIEAAHAAGCYAVAIETTLPKRYLEAADWVVPDHAALLRLLKC